MADVKEKFDVAAPADTVAPTQDKGLLLQAVGALSPTVGMTEHEGIALAQVINSIGNAKARELLSNSLLQTLADADAQRMGFISVAPSLKN